ncbi:MAG: hypothetical protein ACTSU5_22080, partial [Promethearchaeota archaeon]
SSRGRRSGRGRGEETAHGGGRHPPARGGAAKPGTGATDDAGRLRELLSLSPRVRVGDAALVLGITRGEVLALLAGLGGHPPGVHLEGDEIVAGGTGTPSRPSLPGEPQRPAPRTGSGAATGTGVGSGGSGGRGESGGRWVCEFCGHENADPGSPRCAFCGVARLDPPRGPAVP